MVDEGMKALLGRRKNRTLAIMLSEKDELVETGSLSEEDGDYLRKVILDQMNDFYDFCADLLEANSSGHMVNQLALAKLDSIALAVGVDN